jgi:hypothetical protein
MSPADRSAWPRGTQLLRCPSCASRLIYPRDAGGTSGHVRFDRRCPECEYRDSVVVGPLAATVWSRHHQRIRAQLSNLADELARGQAIEPSDLSPL